MSRLRIKPRKRHAIFIDVGGLQPRDPNYGLPVNCWLCATPHKASGMARIREGRKVIHVPLCATCQLGEDTMDRIGRKYLNAPDMTISDGGKATTEQLAALAERQNETEH